MSYTVAHGTFVPGDQAQEQRVDFFCKMGPGTSNKGELVFGVKEKENDDHTELRVFGDFSLNKDAPKR